ncbi:hypothetical protein XAC3562_840160 [Xanthomonas citri pv. citri]|uniref:Uncharacterized protein n=1 Tax=Xanthomonas citri pv. citri TaxID=611301 RepID=A0A0U5FIH7_XANCI|nr:hypothetical protein XAC3562_840160 [Xanthomonas citri pv. citri]CEH44184.1 hypothetical protein XACLD7_11840002 [Xanthomonas citri pv. citri]CEH77560.1 hypothetical protein XAC3612_2240046 [Xanthomonas citri pv. citri]CEH77568.1 hypothetical protein XACLH37_2270045 [Xanthomonas citri pv. citri]CEJ25353.1 hypothetical protein XACE116_9690003 [Xanthomonas citri pv. citri]
MASRRALAHATSRSLAVQSFGRIATARETHSRGELPVNVALAWHTPLPAVALTVGLLP